MPCDEPNKFFVVELCEPIQLKLLEIGCFEFFSSLLENFTVSAADRYPSRDWKTLGDFTAKNEKSLQTFQISDAKYYKYVKVDYLSHYGKEHYCPVSNLKVYGYTIEGEEEALIHDTPSEDGQKQSEDCGGQAPNEQAGPAKNGNVLTKVTDAVAKLANKIIGSKTQAEESQTNADDLLVLNASDSIPKVDSTEEFTHPEPPQPNANGPQVVEGPPVEGSFDLEPPSLKPPTSKCPVPNVVAKMQSPKYSFTHIISMVPEKICDEDIINYINCPLYQFMYALGIIITNCCSVNATPQLSETENIAIVLEKSEPEEMLEANVSVSITEPDISEVSDKESATSTPAEDANKPQSQFSPAAAADDLGSQGTSPQAKEMLLMRLK